MLIDTVPAVHLKGYVTKSEDPLWRWDKDFAPIEKKLPVKDLAETIARWADLGRVIETAEPITLEERQINGVFHYSTI